MSSSINSKISCSPSDEPSCNVEEKLLKMIGESASYYEQDGKLVFFCDNNDNGQYDKKLEKKFVYKKACKERLLKTVRVVI